MSILYIVLAIFGLNFLVFIHELGHYILARRNKMKVEVFSIGFGKPLVSWKRKGVKWQICPIFFGGYVRIAGMEKEGDLEPYEVPDGFYSKKPWARIKVALAGPVVNLVFALAAFTGIWMLGGREKPFHQFTQVIGYVDPQSELYQNGIRPGDTISEYNHERFDGYQDLIYAAFVNGHPATIEGEKVDYYTQVKTPYDYTVTPYETPKIQKGMKTVGIFAPASYLIYQAPAFENLPINESGIAPGDRIVWVNGELIFSNEQLSEMINSEKALLTIQRGDHTFLGKVPRIALDDLRLTADEAIEINDWKYEAGFHARGEKVAFIPYNLTYDLKVENGLYYIDDHSKVARVSSQAKTSELDIMLRPGDKILAVDGIPVANPLDLLKTLQSPHLQIIVKRASSHSQPASWKEEDQNFIHGTDWDGVQALVETIGTTAPLKTHENFHLLQPITPIRLKDFPMSEKDRKRFDATILKQKEAIEKIADPGDREKAYNELEKEQSRYVLGISLTDRPVIFNPNPFALFGTVFNEIARNLTALFSGSIAPKQFGGPLFIMQVMHQSWGIGFKEALFWLGAISLNLGILNLLPIPVLDGGHICFSLLEKIRKKPLKAKTMQRLLIPFIALLVFTFIYLTYNDLSRIFF